jgi:hypothetical protein
MNPRVKAVKYISPYKLDITFLNGEVREFDMTPYLKYPMFENLRDEFYCQKVSVKYGTVVWGDDIDFDPDTLYLEGKKLVSS